MRQSDFPVSLPVNIHDRIKKELVGSKTGRVLRTGRDGTVFGDVLRRCISRNRSAMVGEEAEGETGGPPWSPSMEGTIKFGKSQRLHLIVNFFPSFNKILSASSSLVLPGVLGMVGQGGALPFRNWS